MIDFARLESRIAEDEGFRAQPYTDTLGVWTIGYGTTWINGKRVNATTDPVTEREARVMLRDHLYGCLVACQSLFPTFDRLGPVRQEVLANMAYNLGHRGLARFKRMRNALNRMDFEAAADEMVDSRWYGQVGQRSRRLVYAMRSGFWQEAA